MRRKDKNGESVPSPQTAYDKPSGRAILLSSVGIIATNITAKKTGKLSTINSNILHSMLKRFKYEQFFIFNCLNFNLKL